MRLARFAAFQTGRINRDFAFVQVQPERAVTAGDQFVTKQFSNALQRLQPNPLESSRPAISSLRLSDLCCPVQQSEQEEFAIPWHVIVVTNKVNSLQGRRSATWRNSISRSMFPMSYLPWSMLTSAVSLDGKPHLPWSQHSVLSCTLCTVATFTLVACSSGLAWPCCWSIIMKISDHFTSFRHIRGAMKVCAWCAVPLASQSLAHARVYWSCQ